MLHALRIYCSMIVLGLFSFGCNKILCGEATVYAPNFSEKKFKQVQQGMSISEVDALVGSPMIIVTQEWAELWMYYPTVEPDPALPPARGHTHYHPQGDPPFLQFTESGVVAYVSTNYLSHELLGMTKQQVVETIGPSNWRRVDPYQVVFHYTNADRIKGNGTYWKRIVRFNSEGRVSSVDSAMYYD